MISQIEELNKYSILGLSQNVTYKDLVKYVHGWIGVCVDTEWERVADGSLFVSPKPCPGFWLSHTLFIIHGQFDHHFRQKSIQSIQVVRCLNYRGWFFARYGL